jgi:hypothetical protein
MRARCKVSHRRPGSKDTRNVGGTNLKRYYIWVYANKKRLNTTLLDNRLTDGGEVISLMRRPPLTPPERFLMLISVKVLVDLRTIVRLKGLGSF